MSNILLVVNSEELTGGYVLRWAFEGRIILEKKRKEGKGKGSRTKFFKNQASSEKGGNNRPSGDLNIQYSTPAYDPFNNRFEHFPPRLGDAQRRSRYVQIFFEH